MQKRIELVFLGTGNALINDSGNYHSNLLIKYGDDMLFIDCGSDFPHSLRELGLTYKDVTNLYISNQHADHAGGLEWLGFSNYFDKTCDKVTLFVASAVKNDLDLMLSPSMAPSIDHMKYTGIRACFTVREVKKSFSVGEIKCTIIKTLHVDDYDKLYSYGLWIEVGGKKILFTSDTQHTPKLFKSYYRKADLILHDCSTSPEHLYSAHPHISELSLLSPQITKKMILYHYGPGEKPNAQELGFRGYAEPRIYIPV